MDSSSLQSVVGTVDIQALKGGQDDSAVNHPGSESIVSFYAELPLPLKIAMASFIERYPNWDQYRLIQAALAGFLVQNGVDSREITRLYIGNMFSSDALMKGT